MALVACKECGKEISKKAASCPHCGFKPKRTGTFTWIVTIFVAIPMLIAIFSGASNTSSETQQTTKTPEQIALEKKRDAAVQRATVGAATLKKAMRNPDSFKLESALVINSTDAVCYTYRAQNGFGGVNAGQAVLSADGTRFLTADDMDGFTKLWNKECGGKSGQDVATAIRWLAL